MITPFDDNYFMRKAFEEAERAYELDEVPVGAVIVVENQIIAKGHNLTEQLNDVTAHAEMQSITAAAEHLGGKYLKKCTLYVTLEPCVMCAGALNWSQISKIVYGAKDERRGALRYEGVFHPTTEIVGGVMAEECSELMKNFFKSKR
ncbi:nucleoside deaminase [Brumimicrobium aurantiacum]|uniref:tRNA-specific adenosine deaminase n=1 Tax=Brumimicrobium aurantiacum TaxID=1737063 RepID=A0A3E1EXP5_9FLAO|nr:nucleoside deaminase [Brumimicrobium aurantiacum]RFC54233.1 nucleoside deaminase [Brumimicrobium aurantiacum]